ncbi:NAD(P)/FAD-dependent oxidoreductase [Bradyrhizobium sp. CCBAU 51627]|uniref:NAD(P)/FAD-dependent oxidoreductase n=1 Tax=Bradyrhizobium sp. CCBAU 51627 TaxID=1325088 RepID=UPI002306C77B|nr:NAD(P)/FAD-dependent oxidoreductase [Bradyrhizobium sp. CCBAU 51627]
MKASMTPSSHEPGLLDCLVIGGGPAGLTAALYLARYKRSVAVFDAGRSRAEWIPSSHNYPGCPSGISGHELLALLRTQASFYGISLINVHVDDLSRAGELFEARFEGGTARTRSVLLATGIVTRLSFVAGKGPERLIMYPATKGYPAGLRYAEAPFLVGEIKYKEGPPGTFIYVKATIIKNIDFATAGYLAANPAFPHQTTADQFFSPDQFDAYRLLGYESALRMIESLKLTTTITGQTSILEAYNESGSLSQLS